MQQAPHGTPPASLQTPKLIGGERLQESDVQCLCPNCAERFRRVIYVVRDGRDVMYSYYRFRHGLGQNLALNFSQFIEPSRKHYPGPRWHEHVEGWLERGEAEEVELLLVKYEDLHRNATAVLEYPTPPHPKALPCSVPHLKRCGFVSCAEEWQRSSGWKPRRGGCSGRR